MSQAAKRTPNIDTNFTSPYIVFYIASFLSFEVGICVLFFVFLIRVSFSVFFSSRLPFAVHSYIFISPITY